MLAVRGSLVELRRGGEQGLGLLPAVAGLLRIVEPEHAERNVRVLEPGPDHEEPAPERVVQWRGRWLPASSAPTSRASARGKSTWGCTM